MSTALTADTLIYAGWIIPVIPANTVLQNHALAMHNGRITALLPEAQARQIEAAEVIELPQHVLIPGLINSHGHAAMSLLRGYADDQPLQQWLEHYIWPAEEAHVSEEFVHDGVALAIAEMIRSGTTCFSDMYFFPNITAALSLQAGIRSQITFPIFDFPSVWGTGPDDYIRKGLALRDDHKHAELLRIIFGPHATYTVSEEALRKISTLSAELDLGIHIHLQETTVELSDALQATGERPLLTLDRLGLLGPRTQCVHMTTLNDQDIELLASRGAHVVHCPESNMKLASGICPVSKLLAAGVNVALGTDSAASNNDLSMLGEMRSAALLAKIDSNNAATLPAADALAMATINGARAMGWQDDIGSLEVGKSADLVAVDFSAIESQPLHNPISQLVYATGAHQVSDSWVAGKCIMRQRQLRHLDLEHIGQRARDWHKIINGEDSKHE